MKISHGKYLIPTNMPQKRQTGKKTKIFIKLKYNMTKCD